MKLFFDENLSEALPAILSKEFPASSHPRLCGLAGASDDLIRKHAAAHGFIVVTRDVDHLDLVKLKGPPPKVIWLQFHNPATQVVAAALRIHVEQIEAFAKDSGPGLLIVRQQKQRS